MVISQILKKANLFKALSDGQLRDLVELGREKSFQSGEEVFRHGQEATTLYVLLRGGVCLTSQVPAEFDLMAETLQDTGSVFGTAGLTGSRVYNVTAKCLKPTSALAFDCARMKEIIRQDPACGLEVMTALSRLYSNRLNSGRTAISSLFRIFKSQIRKAQMYEVYGEL